MDERAALSPAFATPFPRWFLSTKKHVILHSFFFLLMLVSAAALLTELRHASILGSSSCVPYWHHPTGISPSLDERRVRTAFPHQLPLVFPVDLFPCLP